MSFILDALKKIEEDKRRADGSPMESIAVSHSRFGGRQPIFAMVAIAVVSALLTATAVSFLSSSGELPVSTTPAADSTRTAETPPPPNSEPPTPAAVSAPPAVREASLAPTSADSSPVATEADPAPEPEPVEVVAATPEPTRDIRIVGRERVLLDGLNVQDRTAPLDDDEAAPEPEAEPSEPLPDNFPNLVLQGTSMIGEDAVAVISDQRVFEGDRIEGALVLRIGEREVELELEGRRFTLRL